MATEEGVPHDCPGTEAEEAGRASACAGCPNQQACQTAPKGPDPDIGAVRARMANVRHKVLVLSGKGGVGKSTFATQLATAIAASGLSVGLMDIDICGPSIPKLLGIENEQVHQSSMGWEPVWVEDNFAVMSVGFLLDSPDDAVIWRGPKKNGLIKQFLRDVEWGTLDYLIVDTPPGTSDEHLSVTQYLQAAGVDGAVVVTTPQEVALMDVRKEINFCHKVNVPVLGVVENMSGFVCPNCKVETQIFAPSSGGAAKMAQSMDVPFLGCVPLDPRLARACDEGSNFMDTFATSPAAIALQGIINDVMSRVGGKDDDAQEG